MLMNNATKVGLDFVIKSYCGKTGRLKGSSGKFSNRLISGIKNKMFVGVSLANLQIGDNDAEPIPTDINVRSIIPFLVQTWSSNGASILSMQTDSQVEVTQSSIVRGLVQLNDGEVRYIKEIGIIDFNRALVKSPSGKKYGLHIVNGDYVEIEMFTTYTIAIHNTRIPITINSNGQFLQTVNATQEFYTPQYATNNPSFQLPAIHPDDPFNYYQWFDLLKGKSGIWMKGEIGDNETDWYSAEYINKNYDIVTDKNIFNANFLTMAGATVKQIVAYTGIRNVLLILTFDDYLVLPNEVTSINLEMKLSGDL